MPDVIVTLTDDQVTKLKNCLSTGRGRMMIMRPLGQPIVDPATADINVLVTNLLQGMIIQGNIVNDINARRSQQPVRPVRVK